MCNNFLGKQVSLMVENGDLDIGTAPYAVKNFLGQDPEGAHLMVKLASTPSDRSEMSPSSLATLALDDTHGLTSHKNTYVNQLPIPIGQQNHLPQNQWSTPNHQACTRGAPTVQPAANDQTFFSIGTNLGAPTVPPGANDHWFPYSDPACTNSGASAVPPADNGQWLPYTDPTYNYLVVYSTGAPAATAQWPTSNDFLPIDTGAPTFAKAPTAAFDHFRDGFGEDIDNSSPNFQPMDPSTAKLLTQLDHLQQDPYGQYQLPLQIQRNLSVQELQKLQYEANNNGLQYDAHNNELQGGLTQPEKPVQDLYGECQQNLSVEDLLPLEYEANNNGLQGGLTQPEKPLQDLYGECQQNLSVEDLLTLEYEANNNKLLGVPTQPEKPLQDLYGECQQNLSVEDLLPLKYEANNNGLQGGLTQPEKPLQDLYGECQHNLSIEDLLPLEYEANNNGLQGGLTQPEKPLQDLYGECQQNFSVQDLLTLEYEANNNGLLGVIPQQHRYHQEKETI
ncbi:hypothetical protein AXX17_AT2G07460 [Arabidopsis thaliana]|uniref:Uncharacterized protein n=1 Tax=Arabidopsis thaliana TaxID=3702 RepID=A0A178VXH8_ARATH|nr:hypothetical protein AXX17_AT2G07460 [Arabidopsis thaliana]